MPTIIDGDRKRGGAVPSPMSGHHPLKSGLQVDFAPGLTSSCGSDEIRAPFVVMDPCEEGWEALSVAIELADQYGGRMSIVHVVKHPTYWAAWGGTAMAPVDIESLAAEDVAHESELGADLLVQARDAVPASIPLTTRLLHDEQSRARQVMRALSEDPGYDVLILGMRAGPRYGAGWRDERFLARRSPVPVMSWSKSGAARPRWRRRAKIST